MLNQPTSSPMMTRMLGFWPCWAEAGLLAIVVAIHNTTRAPQIPLNMLMVAFLCVGCRIQGRSHRPTPPTDLSPQAHVFRQSVGCLAVRKLAEALWGRYAIPANWKIPTC